MTALKELGIILAGMAAIVAALSGCTPSSEEVAKENEENWLQRTAANDFYERDIQLQDGTVVRCLFWLSDKNRHINGMWCREPKPGDND